ncbi:MAG TPA: VanZ family protein [Planctomycetaceae bacterium]|nr:VanZ family protein [Planctomycetaceae bacterium]
MSGGTKPNYNGGGIERCDLNQNIKDTLEGTRHEPGAVVSPNVAVGPSRQWQIDSQLSEARLAAQREAKHARKVFEQVEAAYVAIAVLGSLAFLYLSTIPWVFAVPDFESRLAGVWESLRWDRAQPLDPIANVLAFIPIGFLWSAAWSANPTKRRWRAIEVARVAIGCLVLATVAEVLQFWIPLRDPSIRDILALECGALLGCGLWFTAGPWISVVLGRSIERLMFHHPRFFRLRRRLLIGATYFACVLIVIFASPVRLFWTYRGWSISLQHLPVSRPDLVSPQSQGLLADVFCSAVVALVLVSACFIGQSAVRFFKRRDLSR